MDRVLFAKVPYSEPEERAGAIVAGRSITFAGMALVEVGDGAELRSGS